MEENETRVRRGGCRGKADFCLREVCGGGPPALLAERSLGSGRRRLADRDSADCSSGSWQVAASPSSPRSVCWVSPACDRTSHPFAGDAFLPYQGPGARSAPSLFFLRALTEEETASQAGPGWAGGSGEDEGRRRSQVRDPGASWFGCARSCCLPEGNCFRAAAGAGGLGLPGREPPPRSDARAAVTWPRRRRPRARRAVPAAPQPLPFLPARSSFEVNGPKRNLGERSEGVTVPRAPESPAQSLQPAKWRRGLRACARPGRSGTGGQGAGPSVGGPEHDGNCSWVWGPELPASEKTNAFRSWSCWVVVLLCCTNSFWRYAMPLRPSETISLY